MVGLRFRGGLWCWFCVVRLVVCLVWLLLVGGRARLGCALLLFGGLDLVTDFVVF